MQLVYSFRSKIIYGINNDFSFFLYSFLFYFFYFFCMVCSKDIV